MGARDSGDSVKITVIARDKFSPETLRQRQSERIGQRHAIADFVAADLLPESFIHILTNDKPGGAKIIKRAPSRIFPRFC
jgi:hypothetical protein